MRNILNNTKFRYQLTAAALSLAAQGVQASTCQDVDRVMGNCPDSSRQEVTQENYGVDRCAGVNKYSDFVQCNGSDDFSSYASKIVESKNDKSYMLAQATRVTRTSTKNSVSFGPKGDDLEVSIVDGLTGIEYSEQYGVIFNLGFQKNSDDGTQSLILQYNMGEKEKRILAGAGFKVLENGALMFMGEHFKQQREFNSTEFETKQDKVGVSFRINGYELGASYSKSEDENLPDTELIIDSTTLGQKYLVRNKFVGQEASRVRFGKEFFVGANGVLKTVLGVSKVDDETMADGSLKYTQYMGETGLWSAEVAKVGETKRYSIGFEGDANIVERGATWKLGVETIQSENGQDDNRFIVGLNIPLETTSSKTYNRPKHRRELNLSGALRSYVQSEKSYLVLGQVKETGRTRLVEIDKTSLPAGTTVNAENGTIIVGNLNAFTGFTSILKNGVAVSTSAFSVANNNLVINPDLLEQPANGTNDAYVLTTNGTPANTITIVVARGSKIIKSIILDTSSWPTVTFTANPFRGGDTYIDYKVRDTSGAESETKRITIHNVNNI